MPQEFTTVKASSYDAASLAKQLTEKSADGWDVVSIVNTGTDVTAFLSRTSSGSSSSSGASTYGSSTSGSTSDTGSSSSPTSSSSEPAGWGQAPASSAPDTSTSSQQSSSPAPSSAPAPAAAAAATPAVPAGWYADPAARFDLRYWDGSTWTEHVSRAGQQYTDPPVA